MYSYVAKIRERTGRGTRNLPVCCLLGAVAAVGKGVVKCYVGLVDGLLLVYTESTQVKKEYQARNGYNGEVQGEMTYMEGCKELQKQILH